MSEEILVMTECDELTGCQGFRWLKAAADQGHPDAAYHVATFPTFAGEGFSSPLTADESWRFLILAAETGSVEAQQHAAASGDTQAPPYLVHLGEAEEGR